MSQFVTRTPLSAIRPLGSEAERSHARVAAIVARHVSPQHAQLLADPVPVRDGTGVDWYFEGDGEIMPLAGLAPGEAASVRSRLADMIQEVLHAADVIEQAQQPAQKHIPAVLRHAVTVPGEEFIWAVRDREGLRPLLVAWAYESHSTAASTPFHVSRFAKPRPEPARAGKPAELQGLAPAGGTVPGAGAARDLHGSGPAVSAAAWPGAGWLMAMLLSLALLLLFLLVVAILLPACGLRTPLGTIVLGLPGKDGCFAPDTAADGPSPMLAAASLEGELQVLREEVLRRQQSCQIAEVPPVQEPDVPAFNEVIDERGEYQVTLLWDSADDLDLSLICPNGQRIHYRMKVGCGGVHDVDANAGTSRMDPPVENVTFPEGPEIGGEFQVEVERYSDNSGASSVPFRIRIRTPAGTREVAGVSGPAGTRQAVTTMSRE